MQMVGFSKIGQGGLASCPVDIRLICKYAISTLCTRVITVHNHPSGNSKPSSADKLITEKIKHGLALLDIRVLDHIILTENTYFSFADECLL